MAEQGAGPQNDQGADGRAASQTDILIELAATVDLFHAPDGASFADLHISGHRETWPIRGKGFRRWLAGAYYERTQGAPNAEAMQSALNLIEAKAQFDAPERVVHVRVGGLDGKLYLDLCDDTWRAVEIDATGWRVIESPPVRFRRSAGMKPLPVPQHGGSIAALRAFLNVKSESDFVLSVAWSLACLRNRGPYPVLVLAGEQGTAKSTFSAILRSLLDPNAASLRALPREERDLFIAANNAHVLAFDNVSGIPPWMSDTLCRLATGASFAVRPPKASQRFACGPSPMMRTQLRRVRRMVTDRTKPLQLNAKADADDADANFPHARSGDVSGADCTFSRSDGNAGVWDIDDDGRFDDHRSHDARQNLRVLPAGIPGRAVQSWLSCRPWFSLCRERSFHTDASHPGCMPAVRHRCPARSHRRGNKQGRRQTMQAR